AEEPPAPQGGEGEPTQHAAAPEGEGGTVVQLCDGETTAKIPPGTEHTRETGAAISGELMAQWKSRHPDLVWEDDPDPAQAIVESHDNEDVLAREDTQGPGTTYGNFSEHDLLVAQREVDRFVREGNRV